MTEETQEKENQAEESKVKAEQPAGKEAKKAEKTVEEELEEYKDKYYRLYAEFDNARKRMERDRTDFVKYANEGLITDFLSILDNLELSVTAAKAKHEDYEAFLKGIEMVLAHTHDLLKKNGVKPIEARGKRFDPNAHEILMQEDSEAEENTVLEEFQKGYKLHDKVIRTTKVKLAKKPSVPQAQQPEKQQDNIKEDSQQ